MTIPLSLLVAHFIGDFLLQSDWMAIHKSKRWDVLGLHALVYSLCFVPWGFWFAVVTMATHFLTDAVTSRITSRLWFFRQQPGIWTQAEYTVPKHGVSLVNPWMPLANRRHWFFVCIGADQLLHFAQLAVTLRFLQ